MLAGDTGGALTDTASGGNDLLYGGEGADTVVGDAFGADNALGGADTLYGDGGGDRLSSGSGNDTLFGGAGDDFAFDLEGASTLYGEGGNDTLLGGADGDTLYGGTGRDTLDGEDGDDVLVFLLSEFAGTIAAADQVVGFVKGEDTLAVGGGGGPALVFGTDVFAEDDGGNAVVFQDNDGDGLVSSGDGIIAVLLGVQATTIDDSDFLFL